LALAYGDRVEFDTLNLKVDWDSLRDRVLKVEEIGVSNFHIEESFLNSLMEGNSSSSGGVVAVPDG